MIIHLFRYKLDKFTLNCILKIKIKYIRTLGQYTTISSSEHALNLCWFGKCATVDYNCYLIDVVCVKYRLVYRI